MISPGRNIEEAAPTSHARADNQPVGKVSLVWDAVNSTE